MSKKWTEEGPLMDITTTPVFVDIGTAKENIQTRTELIVPNELDRIDIQKIRSFDCMR